MALCGGTCDAQAPKEDFLPAEFSTWTLEKRYTYLDSVSGEKSQHEWTDIKYGLTGFELAVENEDNAWIATFATSLSKSYREAGLYEEAKSYAMTGVDAGRKSNDLSRHSAALSRLAACNNELGLKDLALENCREAETIAKQAGDTNRLGQAYNMMGEVYRIQGEPAAAKEHYRKANDFFRMGGDEFGVMYTQHNMGINFVDLGELDSARIWFSKPISDEFRNNDLREFEYGIALSKMYEAEGRLDSAVIIGNRFLDMSESLTDKWHAIWLDRVAELERSRGNKDRAWDLREQAFALQEKILGENVKTKTAMVDVQFELQDAKAKNQLLEVENDGQQRVTFGLGVILLLLLGLGAVVFRANRRIRRKNQEIALRNAQLDELLGEKDMIMNIMAHDLKAPLSSISGLLELIANPDTPDVVRKKTISHIERSVDKGTEIISSLLELAALEQNKVETKPQSFHLRDLLDELREDFGPIAERKSIALHFDLPESGAEIHSDPRLLRRILDNFLSNAIKYTPSGKEVFVRMESNGVVSSVAITDQGAGIPKAEQSKLFQKFEKLSTRPTAGESSTGLGLSIAKAIADQLNASLSVDSEVGRGSTFSVSIPHQ